MAAEGKSEERPRSKSRVPSKLRYVEAERIVCATVALKRVHRCDDNVVTVSSRGIQLWSDTGLELSEHLPLSVTSSLRRGNYLFLAQGDRSVLVWRLSPWQQAAKLEVAHKSKISGLAYFDSHLYACGSDGRLAAWYVGGLFERKRKHERRARHPVFEIEEDDLEPASTQAVSLGASRVASLGKPLHCVVALAGGLPGEGAAGGALAVGTEDGNIVYLSAEDLDVITTVQAHTSPLAHITYFEKKGLLFTSSARGRICGWKVGTSDRLLKIRTKGNVHEMVVKKGHIYATSGEKIIRCSISSGKRASPFVGHTGEIVKLRATKNCLFSGSVDGTLRQWDVSSGKCIAVFVGHLLSVRDFHVYETPTDMDSCMPQRSCSEVPGKKKAISMRGSDSLLFSQSVQRSGSGSYAVSVFRGPVDPAARPRHRVSRKRSGDEPPAELIILTASDDTTWRRWKTQDGTLTELEEILLEEEKLDEEHAPPPEEKIPFNVFGARSMGHVGPGMARWSKLSTWEYTGNLSSPESQGKSSPKEVAEDGIHAPSNTPRMLSDNESGSRPASPHGVRWDRRFEYLSRSPRMLALSNIHQAPLGASPRDNNDDYPGSDGCESCGSVSGDEMPYTVPFSSPKGFSSVMQQQHSPVPEAAAAILAVNPSAALSLSRRDSSGRGERRSRKPFNR